VDQARQLPALSLVSSTSAAVRLVSGERPEVVARADRLRPRLVVAADGLMSHTRRGCGIETDVAPHRRWGLRQHLDVAPWTDHVEVYFGQAVEAYVTPLDHGTNVSFLWHRGAIASSDRASAFAAFARAVPTLARRIAGARALDRVRAAGPFLQAPRERARDGLLLMGDAAGYVDAITGEGVGLALSQAEVLGRTLVERWRTMPDIITMPAMSDYLAQSHRLAQPNRQLTRLLLRLARYPLVVERVIGALDRDARLFQHCLNANMGLAAPFRPPVGSVFRLGWSLVTGSAIRGTG
jgi:2-polyprenyl-6-methoxyphenol hydroxylase-like FAD-dependent oxidoreductase